MTLLSLLLLLQLLDLDLVFALLLDLTTHFLLLLSLFLSNFAIKAVTFLFQLSLTHFLPLLLLEVANEALSANVLAFEAFPNTIRHAIEISTE